MIFTLIKVLFLNEQHAGVKLGQLTNADKWRVFFAK